MPKVLNWIRGRKQPAPREARRRRRVELGDRLTSFPIYAIGDVHGSLDLLLQAEQKILADLAGDRSPALVVLLGDYVDRGRDSCGVLEHLLRPPPAPLRRIALCGNHEQLLNSIRGRLWPLGDDIQFVPGHGQTSTFGWERKTNPFVADLLFDDEGTPA